MTTTTTPATDAAATAAAPAVDATTAAAATDAAATAATTVDPVATTDAVTAAAPVVVQHGANVADIFNGLGSHVVYLMGFSFILGSLFTVLILVLLDYLRRNKAA